MGRPRSRLSPFLIQKDFTLPIPFMRRGISHLGSNARLRKVVADMITGEREVKVSVIGGSISWGEGATRGFDDWVSIMQQWLQRAFKNVTVNNGCVPGTTSAYMALCLELSAPKDVDLVFIEYLLNDGIVTVADRVMYNVKTRQLEQLLRRVLKLKKQPAVVMMQYFQAVDPTTALQPISNFDRSSEDFLQVLSNYYDFPTVSFRSAVWMYISQNTTGFTREDLYLPDWNHFRPKGHKILADLAIWLLRSTAISVAASPLNAEEQDLLVKYHFLPSIHGDNEVPNATFCAYDLDLKELVMETHGFELRDEGRPDKPKRGYVSMTPNSWMTIKLNTVRTEKRDRKIRVNVAYLKSYAGMGEAMLTCEGGCECAPVTANAHHLERNSQIFVTRLEVTEAPSCLIKVTNLERTSSSGTKFKVVGIMADGDLRYAPHYNLFASANDRLQIQTHLPVTRTHEE